MTHASPAKVTIVQCPTCNADVRWEPASRFRPFCSERCKQIDLGAWATGQYAIDAGPVDELDPSAPEASRQGSRPD